MAGNRIKGITVEIGGDTTKPQTALKGVNSEIKNTQSQLKDVEKLTTLKTAAEQANQALANGDISKEQYICSILFSFSIHSLPLYCGKIKVGFFNSVAITGAYLDIP